MKYMSLKIVLILANSADSDEMPLNETVSFEHPKLMLKWIGKKIFIKLRSKN